MLYFCDSLNEKLILVFLKIRFFSVFIGREILSIGEIIYLVHKLLFTGPQITVDRFTFIMIYTFFSNNCFILYAQPIRFFTMSVIPDGFYFYLLLYQFSTQIGFTTFVDFYLRPTLLKIINSWLVG